MLDGTMIEAMIKTFHNEDPPIADLRIVNMMNDDGLVTRHVMECRRQHDTEWQEVTVVYRYEA